MQIECPENTTWKNLINGIKNMAAKHLFKLDATLPIATLTYKQAIRNRILVLAGENITGYFYPHTIKKKQLNRQNGVKEIKWKHYQSIG